MKPVPGEVPSACSGRRGASSPSRPSGAPAASAGRRAGSSRRSCRTADVLDLERDLVGALAVADRLGLRGGAREGVREDVLDLDARHEPEYPGMWCTPSVFVVVFFAGSVRLCRSSSPGSGSPARSTPSSPSLVEVVHQHRRLHRLLPARDLHRRRRPLVHRLELLRRRVGHQLRGGAPAHETPPCAMSDSLPGWPLSMLNATPSTSCTARRRSARRRAGAAPRPPAASPCRRSSRTGFGVDAGTWPSSRGCGGPPPACAPA